MKKRKLKSRNPIARVVRRIKPKVVPDKKKKILSKLKMKDEEI